MNRYVGRALTSLTRLESRRTMPRNALLQSCRVCCPGALGSSLNSLKSIGSRSYMTDVTFLRQTVSPTNTVLTKPAAPTTLARTQSTTTAAAYDKGGKPIPFPSILVRSKSVTPVGSFAQQQAQYLEPDPSAVTELVDLLRRTNAGIVAHYYMDVELQGVLQAVAQELPGRVGVADSLRMGDMAVDMVQNPDHQASAILCLGVDFMSESVGAILQQNGHATPVYRAAARSIGCSLAESAEQDSYRAWLQMESRNANALHVVYINTSLETKAVSASLVPTIACTSSNVLQTLLQAHAQIPDIKILYGPDTYMGENLVTLLTVLAERWTDAQIEALHPAHTRNTLRALVDRIAVFPSGNCVVHHMFGAHVVETVEEQYPDAFVTAHLEVPGEMFQVAMVASLTDRGVVGSTSDILKFIARKVQDAVTAKAKNNSAKGEERLQFILGTEAGMVTSIVQSVQAILATHETSDVTCEIVFPVASEAVTATDDASSGIPLVPGVPAGEGCSTAGGCATCPYMKMNDLNALTDVLSLVEAGDTRTLPKHAPPDRLSNKSLLGRPAMELGTEPIGFMRGFQQQATLPDTLVQNVLKQHE